ncbi:Tryptophan synthase alpha chain [Labilithrix luteola]|uniref:Tryptophan synthase alpha chain n=1 Tax=Labilithrix luteola TaxID=1391654 RepID=A0A0K1PZQ7_9BACT|nr:hypothetical protein [Labilithrix luteola]AKU98866.1 Tryptophan synthase alpha chain [Labilithrix luteola]
MFSTKKRLATLGLTAFAVLAVACAKKVDLGDETVDETDAAAPGEPPKFTPPPAEDGGDADVDVSLPKVLACLGTECPDGYDTCAVTAAFKCGTNLMNDNNNCGACGVSCGGYDPINMTGRCVKGACQFECLTKSDFSGTYDYRNCNNVLDDGCEINVTSDVNNCGVCGNKCAPGVHCISGKCGCSNGKTDCNGRCTDPRNDDSNCGACGNVCTNPTPACSPMPANTAYGCADSECGKLKCKSGFADCNQDTNLGCASDGCETNVKTDPNNCGSCGAKCGADQECKDVGFGPQCYDTCAKSGLTACGDKCVDLLSDKSNCGGCGQSCITPLVGNTVNNCKKGICVLECLPNFADCNGNPADGCEVDLRVHPANCGACGTSCNYGEGQPCIDGKCLMVECDAGVQTK